ncbi:YebC/PmpR family DNA-binding transcriptional regulator [Candidatus Parcubacteria bacterium]|nr:YebC/PmpR family DNA-binding transcriptional regulator [Candidatus Parcubacteria bacterium]
MSGHSHAKTILHKKQITDQKRGKIFSKLARQILVAAKEKGGNPETNSILRLAIEQAKKYNMPKDNIDRAIKKGTGELKEEEKLEGVIYEAYGPGGTAIIIEGITDNKNRTLGEIKQILTQHQGKLTKEGAIKWLFERKGCIVVDVKIQMPDAKTKEDLELTAIEAGAQDIYWQEDFLDIYTKPEELEQVKKNLEKQDIKIESASLDWVAKEEIEKDEKIENSCEKLFEALDDNDAVQEIYSNLKL